MLLRSCFLCVVIPCFFACSLAADISLQTGLERSHGLETTTLEEEAAFLARVVEESPRVRVETVGFSQEDRPLQLVTIGYPEAPRDAALDGRPILLIVALQHGNEPSGREGALRFIRELAFSEAYRDYLSRFTVLVMPNTNPDGFVRDQRRAVDGTDPNRDHLALKTPEVQAIARVIQTYRPQILIDAHEGPSTPHRPEEMPRLELLWPGNLNTDEGIRQLSQFMIEEHIFPEIRDAGYVTRLWRGRAGHEGVLRNMSGLRHMLGMVTETFGSTAERRAHLQFLTFVSVAGFHQRHQESIAAVHRAAPLQTQGLEAAPFFLSGSEQSEPEDGSVLDPAPLGYELIRSQWEAIAVHRELFGLRTTEQPDGHYFLPLDQPMRTIIPLLVDPGAPRPVIEARRVSRD